MIFISAGHHEEKKGASYNGFTEHDEAKLWVTILVDILGSSAVKVPVWYLKDKVSFINSRVGDDDIAVEIHFNSSVNADGYHVGEGCETLYHPYSQKGLLLAQTVQQELSKVMPPNRGVREGWYRMNKSNGLDFFLERTLCTSIIIEPEFIHRQDIIVSKRNEACMAIADAINIFTKGT